MIPSESIQSREALPSENGQSQFECLDAFWRAANFLTVSQIFLRSNTLLHEPLKPEHIKPRLLGHWGTCPGLNFIYAHLNRAILETDANVLFIAGPGHGGASPNACAFLEDAFQQVYPGFPVDAEGVDKLARAFSWPGGTSSHVSPYTPGSIHEGGELGYCLAHAYGAVFDNPGLIACCVVGDGEAETGPLAASWHSNKFLNPARDGAVLPILHLNEYKIAGPTVYAALAKQELQSYFIGCGYEPIFVEGANPVAMHQRMASALDDAVRSIFSIQDAAREDGHDSRPRWPMIILRSPKGWTGPDELDGEPVEGSFRSHQVPLPEAVNKKDSLQKLDTWMRSYRPEELFDALGAKSESVDANIPRPERRMSLNPAANGGAMVADLNMPRWEDSAIAVSEPGVVEANPVGVLAKLLREVVAKNSDSFRIFSPDEAESNRLGRVFEVTDRVWLGPDREGDENLGAEGRVVEALSEHLCQGWLEGYLLTGRHGVFASYEAFIHIVDSMFNQYVKWLKVSKETEWRRPVASLNYLLSSHVWQQDHNGFTHQDPGFIDHVLNKKSDIVRVYLPPDANALLSVADHCLKSRNYVNVIVAGKQDSPCWLDPESARKLCRDGMDTFRWASSFEGEAPEIVLACAGDVPTFEVVAAASLIKKLAPELRFRVVNVVDLLCLQPEGQHPHGKPDADFDRHFTKDKPVVFAYHGYPWLIHRLAYKRANHAGFHVRGYTEEGGTTTPFDMRTLNRVDRYHLLLDVARYLPERPDVSALSDYAEDMLSRHREYIRQEGKDMPAALSWKAPD